MMAARRNVEGFEFTVLPAFKVLCDEEMSPVEEGDAEDATEEEKLDSGVELEETKVMLGDAVVDGVGILKLASLAVAIADDLVDADVSATSTVTTNASRLMVLVFPNLESGKLTSAKECDMVESRLVTP